MINQNNNIANNMLNKYEPLLDDKNVRLTTFPIKDKSIWNMYKIQANAFWTVEEVDMSKDLADWKKLNKDEQHFLKYVLAFFASSDAIVNLNLLERFTKEVKLLEAQYVYTYQAAMENIHSEMYSLLIDTYIKDINERSKIFNAIKYIPCVKEKANWAMKWINSDDTFSTRLVAFAIVEGIFFSGSFCAIYWFQEKGLLPGLSKSNEFISRDEGLHTDFACLLYSKLNNKLHENQIFTIIKEAVDIEIKFITQSLPCDLIGMNSKLMEQYIKFVADQLALQLGYKKIYNESNPFHFMEQIGLAGKNNFFETTVTEYSKISSSSLNKSSFYSDEF